MINYSIAIMSAKPGTKKENIKETKAYGVAQASEVLDINAFASHITSHGSVYDKADIVAVLTLAVKCIRELMLDGKRVKLGELGDFQARLRTTGAKTADTFSAQNIREVNVSWSPGSNFRNLRDEASFQLVPTRKAQKSALEEIKNQDTMPGLDE